MKTKHSKEAVDRYIRDYHRVEILWKHGITNIDQISQMIRLSKKVVMQYVDLLPDKIRKSISKNKNKTLDFSTKSITFKPSGEEEVSSAEEQLTKE